MAVLSGGTAASHPGRDWYSSGCLVGSVCGAVLCGGERCVARHGLQCRPEPEVKGPAPGFTQLAGTELTCSSVIAIENVSFIDLSFLSRVGLCFPCLPANTCRSGEEEWPAGRVFTPAFGMFADEGWRRLNQTLDLILESLGDSSSSSSSRSRPLLILKRLYGPIKCVGRVVPPMSTRLMFAAAARKRRDQNEAEA
ncbi:hypothetical protein E2C01_039243 [Portunus trituberculatus]|uniref:Uncharacterized protein n=1 Tax=Portunus trituberculatus TaxID=210409 RepID=A0A5B7FE94_PORTR|nr:hypothetical protein [Portunus trituberculatus]